MIFFEIKDYKLLTYDSNCLFKGIASDCECYYLTCPDCCKIYKFDSCFHMVECIDVCHSYGAMCFDCSTQCFWALSAQRSNRIYKLDGCFCEIDCLIANLPDYECVFLDGIACNSLGQLIVCGNFGIATISKDDGSCCSWDKNTNSECTTTAISCTSCGVVIGVDKTQSNSLDWMYEYCEKFITCCLPDCYKIEDITWNPGERCCWIYVLVTKSCFNSYVLICRAFLTEDKEHPCIPIDDTDCMPYAGHHAQPGRPNSLSPDHDCLPPEPPCPPKDCCESAAGIIESISLVEAALAHILNAEGEKIQKILCESNDSCEIMKVNETVHKTVISITHLEHVLYEKLQTAQELCRDWDSCKSCGTRKPCNPKNR